MKPTRYADPNRLGEVMALIQVLALGRLAIRFETELEEKFWGKPLSAATWAGLAENHREFFRVHPKDAKHPEGKKPEGKKPEGEEGEDSIALIWREALQGDLKERTRPPLSSESVAKLLEIAMSLHDREITRKQRLAYLVPLGAVIIAGLFSILVLLIQLYFKMPPSR